MQSRSAGWHTRIATQDILLPPEASRGPGEQPPSLLCVHAQGILQHARRAARRALCAAQGGELRQTSKACLFGLSSVAFPGRSPRLREQLVCICMTPTSAMEQPVCVSLTPFFPVVQPEMVDVVNRLCAAVGCSKHPNFNHVGQSTVRRLCVSGAGSVSLGHSKSSCTVCLCASPLSALVAHWLRGPLSGVYSGICGALLAVKAVVCARAGWHPLFS